MPSCGRCSARRLAFNSGRSPRALARGASPRVNWFFKRSQILTAVALALNHGTNDAQKTMGVITLGLVTTGYLTRFQVPPDQLAFETEAMIGELQARWGSNDEELLAPDRNTM